MTIRQSGHVKFNIEGFRRRRHAWLPGKSQILGTTPDTIISCIAGNRPPKIL